jgi:predicted phage tail protein
MTTVKFHGFLKKKYGDSIKLNLGRIGDLMNAIDSIKKDFRKTLNELSQNGKHYSVLASEGGKVLEIVPTLMGFGKWAIFAAAIVLMFIGIGWALMAGYTLTMLAGGVGATFLSGLTGFLITTGISLAISALTMPKQNAPSRQGRATGGATQTSSARGKSYIFDTGQNKASQGSIIPIGYGKYKISSKIINIAIKNYDSSISFERVLETDFLQKANLYIND